MNEAEAKPHRDLETVGEIADPPSGTLRLVPQVDRAACIGSGQCVHWAPTVFEQDEEAKALVVASGDGRDDKILKAFLSCPVEAITLQVGNATVRARDLANWMGGIAVDHPLIEVLGRMGEEHEELRKAHAGLLTVDEPRSYLAAVSTLASDHLREEQAAFADLRSVVAPDLVDALLDGHARIDRMLAVVGVPTTPDGAEVSALAHAIEGQIRLEESVLFPVALASLARETDASG